MSDRGPNPTPSAPAHPAHRDRKLDPDSFDFPASVNGWDPRDAGVTLRCFKCRRPTRVVMVRALTKWVPACRECCDRAAGVA